MRTNEKKSSIYKTSIWSVIRNRMWQIETSITMLEKFMCKWNTNQSSPWLHWIYFHRSCAPAAYASACKTQTPMNQWINISLKCDGEEKNYYNTREWMEFYTQYCANLIWEKLFPRQLSALFSLFFCSISIPFAEKICRSRERGKRERGRGRKLVNIVTLLLIEFEAKIISHYLS